MKACFPIGWSLGVVVWLLSSACSSQVDSTASADTTAAERARIVRFWTLYREATQRRLQGELEAALALYQQALALDSLHENTLYHLGNTYLELGRLEDAYQVWQRMTKAHPQSERAYMQIGRLHLCYPQSPLFNLKAAQVAFEQALAINKETTGPLLRLGEVALLERRFQEAEVLLDKVLAANFRSVPAYVFKAYLVWQRGEQTLATKLLEQARPYAKPRVPVEQLQLEEGNTRTGRALVAEEVTACPLLDFDETALADTTRPLNAVAFLRELDGRLSSFWKTSRPLL